MIYCKCCTHISFHLDALCCGCKKIAMFKTIIVIILCLIITFMYFITPFTTRNATAHSCYFIVSAFEGLAIGLLYITIELKTYCTSEIKAVAIFLYLI